MNPFGQHPKAHSEDRRATPLPNVSISSDDGDVARQILLFTHQPPQTYAPSIRTCSPPSTSLFTHILRSIFFCCDGLSRSCSEGGGMTLDSDPGQSFCPEGTTVQSAAWCLCVDLALNGQDSTKSLRTEQNRTFELVVHHAHHTQGGSRHGCGGRWSHGCGWGAYSCTHTPFI